MHGRPSAGSPPIASHRFASRDEQEVADYAAVMELVFDHSDAIDLTENHIRQLRRDLLQFTEKDARHRGS